LVGWLGGLVIGRELELGCIAPLYDMVEHREY
jgi:hypothetical protein